MQRRRKDTLKLETNQRQTEDKLETNWGQTRDATEDKLETNQRQTEDKLETNWGQTRDATEDKTGDKLETNQRQNKAQCSDLTSFSSLSGLQRDLCLFIYNQCKQSRSKCTSYLSIEYIKKECKSSKLSVKKSLQRLEKKSIVIRQLHKAGRGGWTQYELSDRVFSEILQMEATTNFRTNRGQTGDKLETQLETQLETTSSSSSSIKTNTTTTDSQDLILDNVDDWANIDIEPLAVIKFTKNHLSQLALTGKHSPEVVQEAIYAFAFDLSKNLVKKRKETSPLAFFMGVMKNSLYVPSASNYEHPKEKATRIYLEKINKKKNEAAKIEEELVLEHFKIWISSLTDEEINKILSYDAQQSGIKAYKTSELKIYHKEKVWPVNREDFYIEKGLD